MAVERLEFEVTANVTKLRQALTSDLVAASETGAAGMAGAVDRGVKRAEGALDRLKSKLTSAFSARMGGFEAAAKSIQSSALISNLETIGSLGIQAGGAVSQLSILFTSLVRPVATVATAFGPIPLVLGASAVAAIALTSAVVGIPAALAAVGTAAGDAGERLRRMGMLAAEDAQFIDDMRYATKAAAVASDQLTVTLAQSASVVGEMRFAVTGLRAGLADAAAGASVVGGGIRDLAEDALRATPIIGDLQGAIFDALGPGNGNVGTNWALNLALRTLAERGRDATEEMRALDGILKDAERSMDAASRAAADLNKELSVDVGPKWDELGRMEYEAQQDMAEGARQTARAREEDARAAREEAAASREAAARRAEELKINDAALTSRLRLTQASMANARANGYLSDTYGQIAQDAADASVTAEAAITLLEERSAAYFESWEFQQDKFRAFWGADLAQDASNTFNILAGTATNILSTLDGLAQAQIDALREQAYEQSDRMAELAEQRHEDALDAARDLRDEGRISEGEFKKRLIEANQLYNRRKALANAADEDEKILANKAFKRQQAYQIGQALIAAAVSAVALIPPLAYLGWGAPVAAGLLAGGAAGVQIAAIKAQQPPEFPIGTRLGQTSPDHRTVAIQEREAILSRRATEMLGGLEGVDALNRGASGSGWAPEVSVHLDRREIARAVTIAGVARPDRRAGKRARRTRRG